MSRLNETLLPIALLALMMIAVACGYLGDSNDPNDLDPTDVLGLNKPPVVTSIQATLNVPVTTYSVTATDPANRPLKYYWKMDGKYPDDCGTPEVPWTQDGNPVRWSHSSDLPDDCAHKTTNHAVAATVTITTTRGLEVKCSIQGSETQVIKNPKCK